MFSRRLFLRSLLAAAGCGVAGYGAGAAARSWSASRAVAALLRDDMCRVRLVSSTGAIPARRAGDLVYQGTHILAYGALRELAQRYNETASDRRLVVNGGGCDDGVSATRQGLSDLGGLCCPVEGSRAEGMPWLAVARDIKVAVVHRSNSLEGIGLDALRAVARGGIRRWSELGGEDRPVALVVRRHCLDYFEPVRQLLLDNRPLWSARALFVDTDEQLVDTASRFRNSLGLVSWVFARPLVEQGRLKVLAVDGVKPTVAGARRGDYPLTGPLNLVFRSWRGSDMAPFFDFLYSPEGAGIVARALVPVSADEAGYRPGRFI
jgi:phosphate transport system substrate-binding protein